MLENSFIHRVHLPNYLEYVCFHEIKKKAKILKEVWWSEYLVQTSVLAL